MLEDYFTGRIIDKEKYNRIVQEIFNQNKILKEQLFHKEKKRLLIYFIIGAGSWISCLFGFEFGLFMVFFWFAIGINFLTTDIKHSRNEKFLYENFKSIQISQLFQIMPMNAIIYVLLILFGLLVGLFCFILFAIPIFLFQICVYLLYTQRISLFEFLHTREAIKIETDEDNRLMGYIKNLQDWKRKILGSSEPAVDCFSKFNFYTGFSAEYLKKTYRIDEYNIQGITGTDNYLKIFSCTLPITRDGVLLLNSKTKPSDVRNENFPVWLDDVFANEYVVLTDDNTDYSHFLNKTFYNYLMEMKKKFNAKRIDVIMFENKAVFLIFPIVKVFSAWGFSRQKHWNKVCEDFYNETSVVYEMMDYLNRSV